MIKRLTEQVYFKCIKGDTIGHLNANGFEYFVKTDISQQEIVNKLGNIEDVLEKYGIESVEELDNWLVVLDKITREKVLNTIKDRDTWKKACELACERIKKLYKKSPLVCYILESFYQQAQKEMKDE